MTQIHCMYVLNSQRINNNIILKLFSWDGVIGVHHLPSIHKALGSIHSTMSNERIN